MSMDALFLMCIMWAFVAVSGIFVALRLYTRVYLIDRLGSDDYVYVASAVLLSVFTALIQVSVQYGLTKDAGSLTDDDAAAAKMWEMAGLTVAYVGMSIAKWSMGLFLLRIVVDRWQRRSIWFTMVGLLAVSLIVSVLWWVRCLPIRAIFDSRVSGKCGFEIAWPAKVLGMWCVFADLFFAVLPWYAIWNLMNMSRRDKAIIAGSMSLGLIASIFGIVRNINMSSLDSQNYTHDTSGFVLWTAAEIFVTLVCMGIPILRPLLEHWFPNLSQHGSRSTYKKQSDGADGPVFAMHTIGGRDFPGAPLPAPPEAAHVGGGSDEDILGPEYRRLAVGSGQRGRTGEAREEEEEDVGVEYDVEGKLAAVS